MKTKLTILSLMFFVAFAISAPIVEVLKIQQRYPWNGKVDIDFKISGLGTRKVGNLSMKWRKITQPASEGLVMGTFVENSNLVGVHNGTYRVTWDADRDCGTSLVAWTNAVVDIYVNVVTEPVKGFISAIQLWEGGPYWATCNIGATEPEESGYYFWWGDTIGYKRENNKFIASNDPSLTYSFSASTCTTYNKGIEWLKENGFIDDSMNLVANYDAATAHWGNGWRMPTYSELDALVSNCTSIWSTRNGVNGRLFTGKGTYSDRSIFIPAAGYGYGSSLDYYGSDGSVWSSEPDTLFLNGAYYLDFSSGSVDVSNYHYNCRYYGYPVRAVRELAP